MGTSPTSRPPFPSVSARSLGSADVFMACGVHMACGELWGVVGRAFGSRSTVCGSVEPF